MPTDAEQVPHLSARELLSSIFSQVHHLSEGMGRTSGQIDEVSRHVASIAETLHQHIEDESGLSMRLDDLATQSQQRHKALHERLDAHASIIHSAAGARRLAKWLLGGVGSLVLMLLGALLQAGSWHHVVELLSAGAP